MAVSQTYNLQVSLTVVVVLAVAEQGLFGDDIPLALQYCRQQQYHHHGRVSVSLHPPVTG